MRLFIIRHGETNENAQGIVQGWTDTALNEKGLAQAAEAADNFNQDIEAIFSSDLQRATQTAEEFRKHYPTLPYFEDLRIRERDFGDAAGTHRDNHDWEHFWSAKDTTKIPNAETLNEFNDRIRDFLEYLKTKDYSKVLIVAHGGVLNQVHKILNPDYIRQSHQNASIIEVDI